MIRLLRPLLLLLLPLVAFSAEAPRQITGVVGLDELLILAENNSPEISAARRRVDATAARQRQAGLWPNPTLEYMEDDIPSSGVQFEEGTSRVTVGQPIAIGGRIARARAAAEAERRTLEQDLEATRHRIYGEVHRIWVEVLFLQEAYNLQWKLIEAAEETAALAESRTAAPGDSARAALEASLLRTDLLAIITRRSITMLRLQRTLGGTTLNINQIVGRLEPTLDARELAISTEDTVAAHPDSRASEGRIETAEAMADLSRREWLPDVTLLATGGRNRATDESFVGAGIGLPIPLFNRNQGTIAEREQQIGEAVDNGALTALRLSEEINGLLQVLNETDTVVSDYRSEYRPAAEAVFQRARESFEAGEGDLLDLLDAQRTWFQVQRTELDYLFLMNDALARLRHFRLYSPVSGTPGTTAEADAQTDH
jgi:cobalt-zinc-cadmium efflux system outer membrane protein